MLKETAVMFRKRKDGAIIAIFPTLVGDNGMDSCVAYTQAEKKISIDLGEVRQTAQAGMFESLALHAEVAHAGFYPLKIVQRIKGHMNEERHSKAKTTALPPPLKGKHATEKKEPVKVHRKRRNRWLEDAEIAA